MLTYLMLAGVNTGEWEEVVVAVMVVRSECDCGQCQGRYWPHVTAPQYPVVIHHQLRSTLTTLNEDYKVYCPQTGIWELSDVLPGDDREG